MDKLKRKYNRKNLALKQVQQANFQNKFSHPTSWAIANWNTSIKRRAKSGHEITVTIESPTESQTSTQHSTDTIDFNNDDDDDEEDNWSDTTTIH